MNIQNRRSDLDKRYPFPRILCPILASKLFSCFTKILLSMQFILFQASVLAMLRKVPGGLPAKLFRFSSSCKTCTGQTASQPPLPFAGELMICALGGTNLLGSSISPGTIPWRFPRGSHTPSSWQALRELLGQPTPRPPMPTRGVPKHSFKATFSRRRESHPQLTCTPLFLRLNLFISEISNPDAYLQTSMLTS